MYGEAELTPPAQIPEHQHRGQELGDDRCNGSATRPKSEPEDEHRVQHHVQNGADGDGQHAEARVPLRVDERVHARDHHREEGAEQVDPQVGQRIGKGGLRRAEQQQERAAEDQTDCHDDERRTGQQQERRRLDVLRTLPVLRAEGDGEEGRAAGAEQVCEAHRQDDEGEAEPHTGEGHGPFSRDAPEEDPVHDIVQEGKQLRHQHGQGRLDHVAAHGAVFKVDLAHRVPSFFVKMELLYTCRQRAGS